MDLDSIFLSCKVSCSWIVPIGKIVFTIRIPLLSVWFIVSALQFCHIFVSFSSQNVYTSFSSTFYILAFICKRTATGGKIIWIYSTFFLPNGSWTVKQSVKQVQMNCRNLRVKGFHSGKCSAIPSISSIVFNPVLKVKHTKKFLLGRVCHQAWLSS